MRLTILLSVILSISISGCAVYKASEPLESVGFVDRKKKGLISDQMPFQYVWLAEDKLADRAIFEMPEGYRRLYIAPVKTEYLSNEILQDESALERAKELASHFRDRLLQDFADSQDDEAYLQVKTVEEISESDIELQIALAEMKSGKPAVYAAALAVPVPGVASALDVNDAPRLGMEGKLVHTKSGRVLAEFADRRIPKLRVIDINKAVSKSAPLRDVTNDWSKELVRSIQNGRSGEKVDRSSQFSLLPW